MPFTGDYIKVQDFERILDEARSLGVFLVQIAGGEPLMHPNFLEIYEILLKRNIVAEILTNGSLITKELASKMSNIFKKYRSPVGIQISLDSVDDKVNNMTRGLSEKVKEGIENLIGVDLIPSLAMVLTKTNMSSITSTMENYYPKIRVFHLMPLRPAKSLTTNWNELIEEYQEYSKQIESLRNELHYFKKSHPEVEITLLEDKDAFEGHDEAFEAKCAAGYTQLIVKGDLTVITCNSAPHMSIGNLKNDSLVSMWNSPILDGLRHNSMLPCQINNPSTSVDRLIRIQPMRSN